MKYLNFVVITLSFKYDQINVMSIVFVAAVKLSRFRYDIINILLIFSVLRLLEVYMDYYQVINNRCVV